MRSSVPRMQRVPVAFEILSGLGGGMATTGYETAEVGADRASWLLDRTHAETCGCGETRRPIPDEPSDKGLSRRCDDYCAFFPGYGKTSLATHSFSEAIKGRLTKNQSLLPFKVPLLT